MAENTTEGTPFSEKAMGAIVEQSRPGSLLRRVFGKRDEVQPTATATGPTAEPKVSPWVQKAEEKTLPTKDYTVAPDTRVPKKVWGED